MQLNMAVGEINNDNFWKVQEFNAWSIKLFSKCEFLKLPSLS